MLLSQKVSRTMDAPSWTGGWQEKWLLSRPSAPSQGGKAGRCPRVPLCPRGGCSRASRATQLLACPGGDAGLGRLQLGGTQWATGGPSHPGVPGWLAGWSCPGCVEAGALHLGLLAGVRSSGPPAHKPLNRPVSSPDLLWGHFTQVPFHQLLRTDDRIGAGAAGALSSPAVHPASPAWAREAALAVTVPGMLCWAQPHSRPPAVQLRLPRPLCPPVHRPSSALSTWGPCRPLDFTRQWWPRLLLQGLPAPTPGSIPSAPLPGGSRRRGPLSSRPPRPAVPSWPPAPPLPSQCCPRRVSDTPAPPLSVPRHPAGQPLAGCPLTVWPQVLCDFRLHSSEPRRSGRAPEGDRPVGESSGGWPETLEGILPTTSPGASWTRCPGWGLRGPPGGCSARGQRGQWSVETGRARRARNPSGVGEALPRGWGPAQIPGLCRSTPHPQPASSLGGGGSPHHPDPPSTASPSSAPLPGPGSVRLGILCGCPRSCPTLCNPWAVARQAPLSMGFSRHGYWSGLPCPPPGGLPDPGIEPRFLMSPALAGGFFTSSATSEAGMELLPPVGVSIEPDLVTVIPCSLSRP